MSGRMEFDAEAARRVEAAYLTTDVIGQRVQVLRALGLCRGDRALDVGCGPGLLLRDMATTVGAKGRACGIDLSDAMLDRARERCSDQLWVQLDEADACALPHPDESFDAAVSTQVYEYVEDISLALRELFRVLRPGGRAVILDTDYASLVLHTENPERMSRVLSAWGEHFVHAGLPRVLGPLLRDAGFVLRERTAIPIFNADYHENTFSHHLIRLMASFAAGRQGVTKAEADAWLEELCSLGRDGRYFFSLNRYLFVAERPGASPEGRSAQPFS